MSYRVPHQFGKAKLPPGLGEIRMGETAEEPIEMDDYDFEPVEDSIPRTAGMASVPNPKPIGAAKVAQFKQLGTAGGQKMSNFFQHPFTHLGVGILAGMLLADVASDRFVMPIVKHPASTLALTSAGTIGVLSVINR